MQAKRRDATALLLPFLIALPGPAAAEPAVLDEIVVTANRSPTALAETGSAVTVLDREAIERASAASLVSLLRTVPGLSVSESGGPGGTVDVRLRGAETGHTLVLIDGVRVNDSAGSRDEFDFSVLTPTDIERIEVLRGPQSALYGSDAIGGVINIVTRRPDTGVSAHASVEAGSYGTVATRFGAAAGNDAIRLSGSGAIFRTDGFSRVGDRDSSEADGAAKLAGTVRAELGTPGDGPLLELGVSGYDQSADYDKAPPSLSDACPSVDLACYKDAAAIRGEARNETEKSLVTGFAKLSGSAFDDRFEQALTLFGTDYDRENREPGTSSTRVDHFASTSFGAEYQGTIGFDAYGDLTLGGRLEREQARYDTENATGFTGYESDRTLYALFALHQLTLFDDLHLSFAGRYDGDPDGADFLTGRVTAAYDLADLGTTLRASAGTGAKRATAYMIGSNLAYQPSYPDLISADIAPEKSVGVDLGIDQSLFDGRLRFSATGFYNRFEDLISFVSIAYPAGYFENVARAEAYGLELSANATLIEGWLAADATWTWQRTEDLDTGLALARRPENSGTLGLTLTGIDRFEGRAALTYVGEQFNKAGEAEKIDSYLRLDLSASYKLAPQTTLTGRIENVTDADYQDPLGYNTAGRSYYVGLAWTY